MGPWWRSQSSFPSSLCPDLCPPHFHRPVLPVLYDSITLFSFYGMKLPLSDPTPLPVPLFLLFGHSNLALLFFFSNDESSFMGAWRWSKIPLWVCVDGVHPPWMHFPCTVKQVRLVNTIEFRIKLNILWVFLFPGEFLYKYVSNHCFSLVSDFSKRPSILACNPCSSYCFLLSLRIAWNLSYCMKTS